MAGLEEVRRLRKLLVIEKISFNEQLSHAVSISLTTFLWFSLFLIHLPTLRNKNEGRIVGNCLGSTGGCGAPTWDYMVPT